VEILETDPRTQPNATERIGAPRPGPGGTDAADLSFTRLRQLDVYIIYLAFKFKQNASLPHFNYKIIIDIRKFTENNNKITI